MSDVRSVVSKQKERETKLLSRTRHTMNVDAVAQRVVMHIKYVLHDNNTNAKS